MAEKEVQASKFVGKKTMLASNSQTEDSNSPSLSATISSKGSSAKTPSQTGKAPSKSTSSSAATAGGVNKEVLLILQEMNQKLNEQSERLEKHEQRVESITEHWQEYDYSENLDYYDEQYTDSVSEERGGEEASDPHGHQSVFKTLKNKFQRVDMVDDVVNEDLADFVNTSFKNGLTDEKKNELLKDIHRPANTEALVRTRVNQGIWRLLKPSTQYEDNNMQQIQDLIVKATANIVKLTHKTAATQDSEDFDRVTDAIALLGQANKQINLRRKELHKSDLDPKYHYLASASFPFTEYLYGEDTDVNKNIKDINNLNKIGRSMGRGYQRGSFRGRRPHPYNRGRGRVFRGRGQQPFHSAPPKNLRAAPKK